MNNWKYYIHAAISTVAPHENPDVSPIEDGSIWSLDGKKPLFARWTTDFDCESETSWWYVIKDTPFDIANIKAKRRYEINKGIKNFDVRLISAVEHKEAMYQIQHEAFATYPKKYRPNSNKDKFFKNAEGLDRQDKVVVFGAFLRETEELVGYAYLCVENGFADFKVLKAKPAVERQGINAALVAGILEHFGSFLSEGGYICDGARSINHESLFQDYLEKYFGFRKAYCKLNVVYHPKIAWIVKFLYPMRKLLRPFDSIKIVHQISGVIKMEEYVRGEK